MHQNIKEHRATQLLVTRHVAPDRVSHRLERGSHARYRYRSDNVEKIVLDMCAGWKWEVYVAQVIARCVHQGSVWPSNVCSS
jgi:hypothetical protein